MATAAGTSVLPSNGSGKAKRISYAREVKLTAVNHYCDDNNLYQTSNRRTRRRFCTRGAFE